MTGDELILHAHPVAHFDGGEIDRTDAPGLAGQGQRDGEPGCG
jgi:hypothetical protein